MPEITIKYEHPHELTELLSKLAQMYIVPQAICNVDTPYPPDCVQNKSSDDLNAQLKDAEQRESILSAQYSAACRDIDELKSKNFEILSRFTVWKNKVTREKALKDEYKNILEQIHDFITERGLLSDVSFEDGIKHFPLLISCIFKDNKDMRNSLRELGVHVSTKDNSPFIADSDNQLFTLEEAAEYLEVGINEMPLVMANYLPSMDKLTTKEFLLSDLRWIKANLKLSSTGFGEIKAQIRRT